MHKLFTNDVMRFVLVYQDIVHGFFSSTLLFVARLLKLEKTMTG